MASSKSEHDMENNNDDHQMPGLKACRISELESGSHRDAAEEGVEQQEISDQGHRERGVEVKMDEGQKKEVMNKVVKTLQVNVNSRRPTRLESKWHAWKYNESESALGRNAWMRQGASGPSNDVGWGRRIYDRHEIEMNDRDTERRLMDEEANRHANLKIRDVPKKFGLWDHVYDKRVVRTLDTNAHWQPNARGRGRQEGSRGRRERKERGLAPPTSLRRLSSTGGRRKSWSRTGDRLTSSDVSFCIGHTNFDVKSVRSWFKHFRQECPNGKLTKQHLHILFTKVFPKGDAETFCSHIFRIFDDDNNGFLDFKEFLMALDVTTCQGDREKLRWAFRLFDVDDSGTINLEEITAIMETLDEVEGTGGSEEKLTRRASELFALLDEDADGEITMDEFVEGYLRIKASSSSSSTRSSLASGISGLKAFTT